TLSETERGAGFAQELDEAILDTVIPALEAQQPPTCTERVIEQLADEKGIFIGNPVYEGRADLARLLPGVDGVVLDVGCGFGTFTVPLARSAAHVFAVDRSPPRVALTAARPRAGGLGHVTALHADG